MGMAVLSKHIHVRTSSHNLWVKAFKGEYPIVYSPSTFMTKVDDLERAANERMRSGLSAYYRGPVRPRKWGFAPQEAKI